MDEPLRLELEVVSEAPATATRNPGLEDLVEAEHVGPYGALCSGELNGNSAEGERVE